MAYMEPKMCLAADETISVQMLAKNRPLTMRYDL